MYLAGHLPSECAYEGTHLTQTQLPELVIGHL